MGKSLTFFLILTALCTQAQTPDKFNLGFENCEENADLPEGWFKWGNYDLTIESSAHSGEKTVKITSIETGNFGCIAYKIPANYVGKSITLEGYMKIKNVVNGHAGLLMRIDGNESPLEFDNMQEQQISGTRDWQKYSITLNFPKAAEKIFIAGILTGKGEAWFDDFVLTIDGKNIQTLEETEKVLVKAQMDKEFDSGSGVNISNLDLEKTANLELLGRVWGFLKYHHPQIASGNYNWDYALFRVLPSYLDVKNSSERDDLLVQWIESLGSIEKCKKCKETDNDAALKPDLKWIESQETALKNKLLFIYKNRSQGEHYYISMNEGIGNPNFKNEKWYADMPYPDEGFRLLSLYRYWNMINYFFPNKHLTDKDWNSIMGEYIPLFLNAKDELAYQMAVIQIIAEIQDTHANLWGAKKMDEWKGAFRPPTHMGFVENKLVVLDYYNDDLRSEAGLKIGDVITRVNGISIEQLIAEKSKYYPASNRSTMLRNLSMDLLRSNENEIEINFISRDGKEQVKRLKLYYPDTLNYSSWSEKKQSVPSYQLLENNIGYVTLASIKDEDADKIKEGFKDTKGIIIDIRNYPSSFVPFSLGSYFVSSSTPFVKFTRGNVNNPGEFRIEDALNIPSKGKTYTGKLIVLVNEKSQSQSEYTAMAFRAGNNTTIIGSTTAGADGNISEISLPGGLTTMISGIGVLYPNGEETQRIGIVPDIKLEPSIGGIREGKDELVDKAIEIILKDRDEK